MKSEEDTDQGVVLNAGPDSPVNCSICLELVESSGARSTAKLQCGHEFHLDCIGSAFNMKGIMQCPNCRHVEKGQWLYAIGSANYASGFNMDSWMAEQYPFFLVPYGFRICPFRGLMEMDDLSIAGPAFYGHHDNFGEQTSPSSPGFAYFTYFRPHPYASLNPNYHMDGPNLTPFDDSYRQNEFFTSHAFPTMGMHYQTWGHHTTPSSPIGSHIIDGSHHLTLNLRATGGQLDAATGLTFSGQSFSSSQRPSVGTGDFSTPVVVHQNPDGSVYAVGGFQAPYPLNRHLHPVGMSLPYAPSVRRSNGLRDFPALLPAGQPSDPRARFYYPPNLSTGYNLQVTENAMPNYFHAWGRGVHIPGMPYARDSDHWLRH